MVFAPITLKDMFAVVLQLGKEILYTKLAELRNVRFVHVKHSTRSSGNYGQRRYGHMPLCYPPLFSSSFALALVLIITHF